MYTIKGNTGWEALWWTGGERQLRTETQENSPQEIQTTRDPQHTETELKL